MNVLAILLQYSLYLIPMPARMTPAFRLSWFDSALTFRSYFPPDWMIGV